MCTAKRKERWFKDLEMEVCSREADDDGADEVVAHGVFVKDLHLEAVVAFNHVEIALLIPIGALAAAFVGFAAPG